MPDLRIEMDQTTFTVLPLFVLIFVVLLIILWWCKHSFSYLLCFTVFSIYLAFAIDKTFFPIRLSEYYAETFRQVQFTYFINLIPFYFGTYGTLESSLTTLLLNVLLTMPFGFGISFLTHIRARNFLWLALALGFGIEATQFLIGILLGYLDRYVDINDVLMNALGVLVGYVLFRVFAWIYVWVTRRTGIKLWGLAAYIYAVASQAHSKLVTE
ncbi:MAG: VanZ family protein [Anaerolineae bacterium]|nr:VanZ family protein [Anaerolineae bacterium]